MLEDKNITPQMREAFHFIEIERMRLPSSSLDEIVERAQRRYALSDAQTHWVEWSIDAAPSERSVPAPVESQHPAEQPRRWTAMVIACAVAASAIVGGLLLAIAPSGRLLGLSTNLLEGTPFHRYLVPGLVLMLGVGGMSALAVVAQLRRWNYRAVLTLFAGFTLVVWMAAQVLMVGWVHALQPLALLAGFGLVILGFSGLLSKGEWQEAQP